MRVPLAGGPLVELAKDVMGSVYASDGKYVYGSTAITGSAAANTIYKYDVETGKMTVLAAGVVEPRSLVVDADNVYYLSGPHPINGTNVNSVVALSKVAGAPAVLATGTDLAELVQYEDILVYGADDGGLYKLPKRGGMPTRLNAVRTATDPFQTFYWIAPAVGYLYGWSYEAVYRISLNGGPLETVVAVDPANESRGFFVDKNAFYVESGKSIALDRFALAVGAKATRVCSLSTVANELVFNDRFLYFVDNGQLVRMPKPVQ